MTLSAEVWVIIILFILGNTVPVVSFYYNTKAKAKEYEKKFARQDDEMKELKQTLIDSRKELTAQIQCLSERIDLFLAKTINK